MDGLGRTRRVMQRRINVMMHAPTVLCRWQPAILNHSILHRD